METERTVKIRQLRKKLKIIETAKSRLLWKLDTFICAALHAATEIIENNYEEGTEEWENIGINFLCEEQLKTDFPEIWKRRPEGCRDDIKRWFPFTLIEEEKEEYNLKRRLILCNAIEEIQEKLEKLERAEIYRVAAIRLENFNNSYICCALTAASYIVKNDMYSKVKQYGIPNTAISWEEMQDEYPEVAKRKPIRATYSFWFDSGDPDYDRTERIALLIEAEAEAEE